MLAAIKLFIQAQIDSQLAHGRERLWARTHNKIRSAIPHFRNYKGKRHRLSASQRVLGSSGWTRVTYHRPVITKACFPGIFQKSLHPKHALFLPIVSDVGNLIEITVFGQLEPFPLEDGEVQRILVRRLHTSGLHITAHKNTIIISENKILGIQSVLSKRTPLQDEHLAETDS